MKPVIVKMSIEQAKEIMPLYIADLVENSNVFVIGVTDGENQENRALNGVAVVTIADHETYVINYISVIEPYEYGVFEILYTEIERICRLNNGRKLIARFVGEPDELITLARTLNIAGFVPVTLTGHLITYRMKDIKDSKAYRKVIENESDSYMKFVKRHSDLSTKQLSVLSSRLNGNNSLRSKLDIDKDYSYFFVKENDILGLISFDVTIFSDDGDSVIMLDNAYVEQNSDEKMILPSLVMASMLGICDKFNDESSIILELNKLQLLKGIFSIFGEPRTDNHVFEYVKFM